MELKCPETFFSATNFQWEFSGEMIAFSSGRTREPHVKKKKKKTLIHIFQHIKKLT